MRAYHGSNHKHNRFTLDHLGTNNGYFEGGVGIYFTTSIGDAKAYGKYVYHVDLMLQNPLSTIEDEFDRILIEDQVRWLIQNAPDRDMMLANWNYMDGSTPIDNLVNGIFTSNFSESEIFGQVWYEAYRYEEKAWVEGMVQLGYDGIFIVRANDVSHFIMFDTNNISIVNIESMFE